MLAISMSWNLESRSIDFFQASSQEDIKTDICMERPYLFDLWECMYVLKLQFISHGLYDSGITWLEHFKESLED